MQTSVDMVQRNDPIVYVQDACYWVKHNPDKFKRLMHLCHREVDAGNPRVTRGDIYNLAREAGLTFRTPRIRQGPSRCLWGESDKPLSSCASSTFRAT